MFINKAPHVFGLHHKTQNTLQTILFGRRYFSSVQTMWIVCGKRSAG